MGKNSERPPWFVGPKQGKGQPPIPLVVVDEEDKTESDEPPRKKSQKSLTSFFTKQSPGLTKEEQQEIDDNLAMFCYCSGSSFQTLENPYLQKVLEICRLTSSFRQDKN